MSVDGALIALAVGLVLVLAILRLRKHREITRAWAASSHRDLRLHEQPGGTDSEPRLLQ